MRINVVGPSFHLGLFLGRGRAAGHQKGVDEDPFDYPQAV